MFSLRHLAYATVFLMLFAESGSAQPDFNVAEIDVDLQLASLPLPPDVEPIKTSDFLEVEVSSGALRDRSAYLPVIVQEAAAHGVPPVLVDAVVRIESRYDPTAVGSIGEVGLMQVRPKTAALLGFQGSTAELAEPRTNLRYGVSYLAKAWRLAGGDLCRALMKYRAGHGSKRMSALSVEYCRRARLHLAAVGAGFASPDGVSARPSIQGQKDVLQRKHPRRTAMAAIRRGDACRPQQAEACCCSGKQSPDHSGLGQEVTPRQTSPGPARAPSPHPDNPPQAEGARELDRFPLAEVYKITAEMPDLDEANIEVKLSNAHQIFSGKAEKDANYRMSERRHGSFRRSFRLPENVNADKIEASFNSSILTSVLPRARRPRRKPGST